MFKKHYIQAMSIGFPVAMALLIFLLTPPLIESDNKPYPVKPLHIPAKCWTEGENHPYPNQVMYAGDIRGQKVVDALIGELFDGEPSKYDPTLIQYFCKR